MSGEGRRIRRVNALHDETCSCSIFVTSIRERACDTHSMCHGAADGGFHGKAAGLQSGQEGVRAIISFCLIVFNNSGPYFSKDKILWSYPVAVTLCEVNDPFSL